VPVDEEAITSVTGDVNDEMIRQLREIKVLPEKVNTVLIFRRVGMNDPICRPSIIEQMGRRRGLATAVFIEG
jgi:hypothetical protein